MSYIPVPGLFRVRMASTANLTLSGTQTIDGIVGVAGDIVLAKDQTTGSQNGPYVMAAGAWARLAGADNAAELVAGSLIVVSVGTTNGKKIFELTTAAGFVVGTNTLTFEVATSAASIALATTAPADVGGTAAVGVGTTAARSDHVHDFTAPITTSTDVTGTYAESRVWTNGTNTAVDISTPGQIKINFTGGAAPSPADAAPPNVSATTSTLGVSTDYAREDHTHGHGNLPGGALHAVVNAAESGLAGFMSMADKTKLDGIEDFATANQASDVAATEITDATASAGAGLDFSRYDHVHSHGLRGAGTTASPLHTVATNEAPGFMAAADHAALALWDVSQCRYYFVDNEAGTDAHVGFLDRAPGHDFGGGEAAAVAAVKIKTIERLLEVLPRNGNGRMAKILLKNRAAGTPWLKVDGVTLADLDLTGIHGYRWIGRCGSTDFENGTTDMIRAGGIIAVDGPNGDFSFTAATGGTTGVTIASGTFGPDAYATGLRVRFQGNVTPEVADLCVPISRLNSTTSLDYGHIAFPAPAAGDKFFIERIGVTFNNVFDISSATTMSASDQTEMVSPMVGIQAQADTGGGIFRMGAAGKTTYAFCSARNAGGGAVPRAYSDGDAGHIVISDSYVDEIGQTWAAGPCHLDSTVQLQAATIEAAAGGLYCTTDNTARTVEFTADSLQIGHGGQFRHGVVFTINGAGPNRIGDGGTPNIRFGTTTTLGAAAFLRMGSSSVVCNGWIFDTAESSSDFGIVVSGGPRAGVNAETLGNGPQVVFQNLTGGVTHHGISIVNSWNGRFYVDNGSVAFGFGGGYFVPGLSGNTIQLGLAFGGSSSIRDVQGNESIGDAGPINTEFQFVKCGPTSITTGDVVSVQSSSGGFNVATLNVAGAPVNSCVGVAISDMVGFVGYGYVCTRGAPFVPSAIGFTPGEVCYLDPVLPGKVTNVPPPVFGGYYKQRIGTALVPGRVLLAIELVADLADGNP